MPAPSTLSLDALQNHMVWVEGGTFEMGGESGHDNSKPIYPVEMESFYICRYPVTQALWEAVMGNNPAAFPHPQRPVEQVSWYDCVEFCNALSEWQGYQPVYEIDRERKDPKNRNNNDEEKWLVMIIPGADGYRLPTEADWEYAARGGRYAQLFAYTGSPNQNEVAWWERNSQGLSQPAGLKLPNALGLFDMSGNVREWVWDWYEGEYYQQLAQGQTREPASPDSGSRREGRVRMWIFNYPNDLRLAYRNLNFPDFRDNSFGCRLCRYPVR